MDGHRPFRFGVYVGTTPDAWAGQVRRAEELGYDTLSVGEHIFSDLAPISALATAAMLTSTIRIGSLTFANDLHHPVTLAKEVVTLDALSGGRFEFGFGSGFFRMDYDQTGIPFGPPGVRLDRFFDAVHLIKAAFAEEHVDHAGQHYTVSGLSLVPKPVQHPHPPLLIGGGGRRVLQFAAREADIVSINIRSTPAGGFDWASISPEATARKIAWVREAAGERFADMELHALMMRVVITEDPETAAREFIDDVSGFGAANAISVAEVLASPHVLMGSEEEIVETIQRRRNEYGISYVTVFDDVMEQFAPIAARLSGS